MVEECARAGRWFGGCRFEARYDEQKPDPTMLFGAGQEWMAGTLTGEDALKNLTTYHYVRDVCTRCGRTVERGNG